MDIYRLRRTIIVCITLLLIGIPLANVTFDLPTLQAVIDGGDSTLTEGSHMPTELAALAVKGRAPKTGYERAEFGNGWDTSLGCDTRNRILARDLKDITTDEKCKVLHGILNDPYTGKIISFERGESTSDDVQIDHVVALSNAWQTGAQQFTYDKRVAFSNDPLNLLAVDGPTNENKSDSDAATWLPPNKSFRCEYIKRQIAVKTKYGLWVTPAEQKAMAKVLSSC